MAANQLETKEKQATVLVFGRWHDRPEFAEGSPEKVRAREDEWRVLQFIKEHPHVHVLTESLYDELSWATMSREVRLAFQEAFGSGKLPDSFSDLTPFQLKVLGTLDGSGVAMGLGLIARVYPTSIAAFNAEWDPKMDAAAAAADKKVELGVLLREMMPKQEALVATCIKAHRAKNPDAQILLVYGAAHNSAWAPLLPDERVSVVYSVLDELFRAMAAGGPSILKHDDDRPVWSEPSETTLSIPVFGTVTSKDRTPFKGPIGWLPEMHPPRIRRWVLGAR